MERIGTMMMRDAPRRSGRGPGGPGRLWRRERGWRWHLHHASRPARSPGGLGHRRRLDRARLERDRRRPHRPRGGARHRERRAPSRAWRRRPAAATGYGDTGLTVGTTYWYRVRSLNAAGPSAWTELASATPAAVPPAAPAAPSGLTAAATATDAITLTWADNASNETGFEVERASAATGPFGLVKTAAADATSWTDTGLPPGTPYWYRIRAVNGAGASTTEGPATATTGLPALPAAPTGLAAAGRASGTNVVVDVSWTNVATNESSYELQKYWGSVGTYGASIVLPAGSTSYLDEAPANMFTNHYRVRAVNAAGPSAWTELSIYVGVVFIAPCPPPTAASADGHLRHHRPRLLDRLDQRELRVELRGAFHLGHRPVEPRRVGHGLLRPVARLGPGGPVRRHGPHAGRPPTSTGSTPTAARPRVTRCPPRSSR